MPDESNTRTQQIEKRIDPEVSGTIALSAAAGTRTIAPENMAQMFEFAKMMAISGPCVRPAFRGNPGACLAIALQAFRTGADPFAVANKAYITTSRSGDEQIAYEAQYIHAVVNNSGRLKQRLRPIYSGTGGNRKCKIVGHVVGEDEPLEYESPTVDSIAVKNSPLWKGDPDQQLFYYSSRAWARRHLPEVMLGMYTGDEIKGEIIDITPPARPRPEDYAEKVTERVAENLQEEHVFEVVDLDGEIHECADADRARETLLAELNDAKSRGRATVVGLWESNEGTIKEIGEVFEDGAEPLHQAYAEALASFEQKQNPGDTRQDRPRGAEARQPDAPPGGATISADRPGQQAPPQPQQKGEARKADEPGGATVRDDLAVPIAKFKAVGRQVDYKGLAAAMKDVISKITDLAETLPLGPFVQANKAALEAMRTNDKDSWVEVQYWLGERERQLRTGEP
jgi:hypothetical protein